MTSATIHLIAGATGAGKTTHAIALAERVRGFRFSIDEWMTSLFWMDSPRPIAFDWTMERIDRCEALIRTQVAMLVKRSVDCILDLGFTKAAHRAAFAEYAKGLGANVKLHFIDISSEVRWHRVSGRNAERGETFAMEVDRAMFDFMEHEWEAPDAIECRALNAVVIE